MQQLEIFLKGAVGISAPIIGMITSAQAHIEWGLRVTSLLVGIAVGLVTVRSILRKEKAD